MHYKEYSIAELITIVNNHNTLTKLLEFFGLRAAGGNYKQLHKYFSDNNIDYTHIKNYKCHSRPKNSVIPDFNENSKTTRRVIKKYIIKYNLIEYKCACCGIIDSWANKPLTLQIDHINGVYNDNRLENLRFLCPNCHSQTNTFAGKNSSKSKKKIKTITPKPRNKKINWPEPSELIVLLKNKSYTEVGKLLGVSDNAIRKHLKHLNIAPPKSCYIPALPNRRLK